MSVTLERARQLALRSAQARRDADWQELAQEAWIRAWLAGLDDHSEAYIQRTITNRLNDVMRYGSRFGSPQSPSRAGGKRGVTRPKITFVPMDEGGNLMGSMSYDAVPVPVDRNKNLQTTASYPSDLTWMKNYVRTPLEKQMIEDILMGDTVKSRWGVRPAHGTTKNWQDLQVRLQRAWSESNNG